MHTLFKQTNQYSAKLKRQDLCIHLSR